MIKIPGILLFTLMLFCVKLTGQVEDSRKSEEEIQVEDRFVHAKLLALAGKKSEAIKLLDTLRRASPTVSAIYFELAKLHRDAKAYNLAENSLATAVKLEPDQMWYRIFEVSFDIELGRVAEAIQVLRHLSKLYPQNPDFYDQIVQLQVKNNSFNEALSTLEMKEKNMGFAEGTTLKKAEILDLSGKPTEAIAVIQTLVQKFPGEKKYLRLIAKILHSNDMVAEAEPYLRKILEIDATDTDAKLGLLLLSNAAVSAENYLVTLTPLIDNKEAPIDMKIKALLPHVQRHAQTGDTLLGSQLITLCDKLVIAHPSDAKSHAIYGDVLKNNGNTTAAIRQYEKTLTLNKKNFLVWEQLMFCLDVVENYDRLLTISNEAIDLFPNQAISYFFAGKAWIKKQDFKKAFSMLEEASLVSAGSPDIACQVLIAKAEIAVFHQEWEKANTLTDQALQLSEGKFARAAEIKGDLYKEKGDLKNAGLYWRKAQELGSKSVELNKKIESLKSN